MKYYTFNKVLSYNGVYNFIVGGRGIGKTYGAKRKALKDYLRWGHQFIYLRRYDTELRSTRSTFMADIGNEFPDIEFRVTGDKLELCRNPDGKKNEKKWETAGYFIPLSKAQSRKSVSYEKVRTIIFDEFIIERGALHYLPDEAKVFNDFYSTVDRWKDKTRVFFLANSVSIMNPYFLEYDVKPTEDEIKVSHNGFVVCHFVNSRQFANDVFKTRFGSFIKDSDYAKYSVGNEFFDNTDAMVGPKPSSAQYYATLETKQGTFSLWVNYSESTYYVSEKRPKKEMIWTMLPESMTEDKAFVTRSDRVLQMLRTAFSRGRVTFSSPQARNAFTGIAAW